MSSPTYHFVIPPLNYPKDLLAAHETFHLHVLKLHVPSYMLCTLEERWEESVHEEER